MEENKAKPKELKNIINIRKPVGIVYRPLGFLILLIVKLFFRVKYDKTDLKKIKGRPFLLIANHTCILDFIICAGGVFPRMVNFLAARFLFSLPIVRRLIDFSGAIPKKQFVIDLQAIKLMKEGADKGLNMALMPEGKISMDGTNSFISASTAKLIKFLGIPVVAVHINGGCCTIPKWGKGFRRGHILAKYNYILDEEQIKSLSNEEILKTVKEAISFNDPKWQVENHIRFKSKKPARNLNFILYKCPKCGAEYQMEAGDDFIRCSACNNTVKFNEYGELTAEEGSVGYPRIDLWYSYEREEARKDIDNINFSIEKKVDLFVNDTEKRQFIKVGEGVLRLDYDNLSFKGDFNGEPYELSFPTEKMPTLAVKASEEMDLADDKYVYKIKFQEKKFAAKYTILVEEIYKRKNHIC